MEARKTDLSGRIFVGARCTSLHVDGETRQMDRQTEGAGGRERSIVLSCPDYY